MAKSSKPVSSDESFSNGSSSSEDERIDDQINVDEDDEEELRAVARSAAASDEDDDAATDENIDDADDDESNGADLEISKRQKDRLKEMQKLKKQKIQEILDAQNIAIDADMNNRGKGRLKYLLQQTELFAHFAKGDQSALQKKVKGRGRHASKITEEEEDEECLKEEEDGLSGNT